MAVTISLLKGSPNPSAPGTVANRKMNMVVSLANGTPSVTLTALVCNVAGGNVSVRVSQPDFQTMNVSPTDSNPTLAASTTYYYPFSVVFFSPNFSGPSASGQFDTSDNMNKASVADPFYTLEVMGQVTDGTTVTVFSTTYFVPVLSTVAPYPIQEGGAFQFTQGNNLTNGLVLGML